MLRCDVRTWSSVASDGDTRRDMVEEEGEEEESQITIWTDQMSKERFIE